MAVGGHEGGGGGDVDGRERRGAGGPGGKDGSGSCLDAGIDEVFDLVDVGLRGGVEGYGVAV